jgi:hypothetical protein
MMNGEPEPDYLDNPLPFPPRAERISRHLFSSSFIISHSSFFSQ